MTCIQTLIIRLHIVLIMWFKVRAWAACVMIYLPAQLVPFPVKPGLQKQLNDPSVLLQEEWILQLSVSRAHSSISK